MFNIPYENDKKVCFVNKEEQQKKIKIHRQRGCAA